MATKAIPATCFPAVVSTAASWDIELLETIGNALAEECLENDVQIAFRVWFEKALQTQDEFIRQHSHDQGGRFPSANP